LNLIIIETLPDSKIDKRAGTGPINVSEISLKSEVNARYSNWHPEI
jgi:hypothetical protein